MDIERDRFKQGPRFRCCIDFEWCSNFSSSSGTKLTFWPSNVLTLYVLVSKSIRTSLEIILIWADSTFSSMASILTFQHHTSRMTGVGVAFTQTINGLYNKVKVVWVEKEVSFPSIKNKIKLNLLKEIFCERLPLTCVCGSTTADKWRLMPRPHCAQCSECPEWLTLLNQKPPFFPPKRSKTRHQSLPLKKWPPCLF